MGTVRACVRVSMGHGRLQCPLSHLTQSALPFTRRPDPLVPSNLQHLTVSGAQNTPPCKSPTQGRPTRAQGTASGGIGLIREGKKTLKQNLCEEHISPHLLEGGV